MEICLNDGNVIFPLEHIVTVPYFNDIMEDLGGITSIKVNGTVAMFRRFMRILDYFIETYYIDRSDKNRTIKLTNDKFNVPSNFMFTDEIKDLGLIHQHQLTEEFFDMVVILGNIDIIMYCAKLIMRFSDVKLSEIKINWDNILKTDIDPNIKVVIELYLKYNYPEREKTNIASVSEMLKNIN